MGVAERKAGKGIFIERKELKLKDRKPKECEALGRRILLHL